MRIPLPPPQIVDSFMILLDANYDDSGPFQLVLSSPSDPRVCINITITNDDTLEENEQILLTLLSDNSYVNVQNNASTSVITIVDDDGRCKFLYWACS